MPLSTMLICGEETSIPCFLSISIITTGRGFSFLAFRALASFLISSLLFTSALAAGFFGAVFLSMGVFTFFVLGFLFGCAASATTVCSDAGSSRCSGVLGDGSI